MTLRNGILASTFLATLVAAGPALSAGADIPSHYFYVGGHLSQYWFGYDQPDAVDDLTLPGLQAGYRFSDHWSVEARWQKHGTHHPVSGRAVDVNMAFAGLRRHFPDDAWLGFEPYIGVDAGRTVLDESGSMKNSDESFMGAEFGAQRRLKPHWILDIGVRAPYSLDDDRWDGSIQAGLNYVIGGGQPEQTSMPPASEIAPAPTLRDTDKDGVPDTMDACPGTPQGSRVNENGCVVGKDSDGDGVTDNQDKCPNTPKGTAVDAKGCMADADGDGVADANDKCPGTPAGALVDATGCRKQLTQTIHKTLYIEFGLNNAKIQPSSKDAIQQLGKLMREYPDASLELDGYTDSTGKADYNQQLSQKRAEAVKQALVNDSGIGADRIKAVGKGEANPIADNGTAKGRAKNRRVEAVISGSRQVPATKSQ